MNYWTKNYPYEHDNYAFLLRNYDTFVSSRPRIGFITRLQAINIYTY